jgi:hypothetical protein
MFGTIFVSLIFMKAKLLFLLFFLPHSLYIPNLWSQITFSEIMYDVSTNEYHDEFIEIFNLSYQDSIDITGWRFSDSSDVDNILPYQGGKKIAPRSFALILDGSYFNNSTTYDTLLADSLVILMIEDNSFGKNGLSNSKAEWLTISDSTSNVLTGYRYSIGNKPGYSDEKIDPDGINDTLNWSVSRIEGGTPGTKNSVSPDNYDFGFAEESLTLPTILFSDDQILIALELSEYGLLTVSDSLEVIVFNDHNRDKKFQNNDWLISHIKLPAIAQKFVIVWENAPVGEHLIVARLYFSLDEISENDVISKTIRIINRDISLHINEIKFLTDNDEPEWIELVNFSGERILLKDWSIADLSDTVSIDSSIYLNSGEYIVISDKLLPEFYQIEIEKMVILNKFPTLNDPDDQIMLIDPLGIWKEKVRYEREWLEGEEFRFPSLEKIHPLLPENQAENWGPSVDMVGASPGRKNSIFSELSYGKTVVMTSPNPFSPNADGYDDVTIISGEIPDKSTRIRAEVYDTRGRLINTLIDNRFSGSHFNFVWDGRDEKGRIARIGIYIIFIQALNDRLGVLREMRTTVVLAQIL